MKKSVILIILIIGIGACQDQDVVFPDYNFQAVYFPIQLPLRTLSLGEDRLDNSLDREYKFDIGVSIGGMYINNKDWTVDYVTDLSLTDSVYTNFTPILKINPLPSEYYTLNPQNTVTIPKGSFNGLIRVELNEQFFEDPAAIIGTYVIPLRITGSSADSVLSGSPVIDNPDRREKSHWETLKDPRDWVMFGIKYVNAYHGYYLHRGREIRVITDTGDPFDTIIFRNQYIEKDALIKLTTTGKKTVTTNRVGSRTGASYSMMLEFDNDKGNSGNITISPRDGFPFVVSGSGQYKDKSSSSEQWSLLTWQAMYLSYSYVNGIYTHHVVDTLVFRDRDIKYEELSIMIRN